MTPKIRSGQLATVAPVDPALLEVGDVVLCNVNGSQFLHLVSALDVPGSRVQISNNHGHVNGWTSTRQIHGRLVALGP